MTDQTENFMHAAAQIIYNKKGFNILGLDVRDVSSLCDYMLIAEGNVDRHVIAIAGALIEELKKQGEAPIHVEGLESGDWVVLDYLNVIIHLFMPGLRDKYELEKLWSSGKIVDLKIDIKETS